jgi:hypothetical protein
MSNAFLETLAAAGPHPSLGAHADTYARVIGSWIGELHNHLVAPVATASVEVHFSWALEGRAVQDVWITPTRKDRAAGVTALLQWFGTTLRVFDPKSESWRATWWDPGSGRRIELEGRREGDDIVQLGTRDGRPIRWTFSQIRPTSFVWQGHILHTDGATWRLEVEMRFRRP